MLLAPRLSTTAAHLAARLRRVRPLPKIGELGRNHLMHGRNMHYGAEDRIGEDEVTD